MIIVPALSPPDGRNRHQDRQSTPANWRRGQMTTMARFLVLWGTPEDPD
jgi:hypothetical protein